MKFTDIERESLIDEFYSDLWQWTSENFEEVHGVPFHWIEEVRQTRIFSQDWEEQATDDDLIGVIGEERIVKFLKREI